MKDEPTPRKRGRPRGVEFRADLMREARLERGWTQKQAAEAIGVIHRGYQKWERDGRTARTELNNFAKISQVFGIPREKLARNPDPVVVLSEVERLEMVEMQLVQLAAEVRRARRQLRDQDEVLKDRLEGLGSAIERLSGAVADLSSRTGSEPGSASTRANG